MAGRNNSLRILFVCFALLYHRLDGRLELRMVGAPFTAPLPSLMHGNAISIIQSTVPNPPALLHLNVNPISTGRYVNMVAFSQKAGKSHRVSSAAKASSSSNDSIADSSRDFGSSVSSSGFFFAARMIVLILSSVFSIPFGSIRQYRNVLIAA